MKGHTLTALSLALSVFALNAVAAVPADYPKIKPGLWETQSSGFNNDGKVKSIRQCMDAATIAESEKAAADYEKQANCKTTYQKQGNTYISDSVCNDKTSGVIKTHTEVTQLNANSIKSVARSTVNGQPMKMGNKVMGDMVNTSTRIGDCKANAKSEGVTLGNGQTVNFDDLIKQAQQSAKHKH
ncbi:MAG: DUF3617 family protein [Sulfuriferula sp.]|nr:DUF3617 family protein [Sulfuriferula sp.]